MRLFRKRPEIKSSGLVRKPLFEWPYSNRSVKRHCKNKKPEYEILRETLGLRYPKLLSPLPGTLAAALEKDSIYTFNITCDLCGEHLSLPLLFRVATKECPRIVEYILTTMINKDKAFPFDKTLFFVCGNKSVPETVALAVLHTLETLRPGISKATIDPFGSNLLLYAYIYKNVSHASKLIQALLEYGVNFYQRNDHGINYAFMSFGERYS